MSFSSVLFAFDANHTIGIRPFKDREHSLRIISLAFGRSKQNREIVENHIVGIRPFNAKSKSARGRCQAKVCLAPAGSLDGGVCIIGWRIINIMIWSYCL